MGDSDLEVTEYLEARKSGLAGWQPDADELEAARERFQRAPRTSPDGAIRMSAAKTAAKTALLIKKSRLRRNKMPHHAKASGWPTTASHRWFARCDQCTKWRLFGLYYEVYPPLNSDAGWWWACADCMITIASDQLEEACGNDV